MAEYGMPYMGSKDKVALSICSFLPKADHFYDLFGGGGAITHCMALRKNHKYKTFTYNDVVPGNALLLKKAIAGDYSYRNFKPKWVSREDFFRLKDHDPYVRCIWSFGNNQKNYLFGPDIEPYKREMHNAIVFGEFSDNAKKILGFEAWPKTFPECDIKRRRLYFGQRVSFLKKGDKKLQQLKQLKQLQQLERLEQLQRLEQLEQLEPLSILTGSYQDVEIKPNSVIYCDPPYKNTGSYLGSFDHGKFLDWAANIDHPVYISEYDIKDDRFDLVYKIDKRPMFNGSKASMQKSVVEKVYWNRKQPKG